jgi:hypothetical protein
MSWEEMSIAERNARLDAEDTDDARIAAAEWNADRDADNDELGRAEDRAVWGGRPVG